MGQLNRVNTAPEKRLFVSLADLLIRHFFPDPASVTDTEKHMKLITNVKIG